MAFTTTSVNDIKVYQLPQSVYKTMVQNNEIDENSFYLTTGDISLTMLQETDVNVDIASWVDSSANENYLYQAKVNISDATANMLPEVCFSFADAISGNFAPVAESVAGGVIIYAKEKPTAAISIATITLWLRE